MARKHVTVTGNQFIKNTLWSIGMMPGGRLAPFPEPPRRTSRPAGRTSMAARSSPITSSPISALGQNPMDLGGGKRPATRFGFDHGQVPENPPLTEVIIQGNLVYDTGRDTLIKEGKTRGRPSPIPVRRLGRIRPQARPVGASLLEQPVSIPAPEGSPTSS